jgi:RNA-directed DNA polymerase
MTVQGSFLSLLEGLPVPMKQEDHFRASHLEDLFRSKIARSQATGKDGVRIAAFAENLITETRLIEQKAFSGEYRFTPYKERLILRGSGRVPRQISIPTVRDRLTLRAVCQLLHAHVSESLGNTPHALIDQVVKAVRRPESKQKCFIRVDVKDFFPSLLHDRLAQELQHFGVEQLARFLCMQAVKTATGSGDLPERGIPQGLSISGALAAIYMIRFDRVRFRRNPTYVRYVDDVLFLSEPSSAPTELKSMTAGLRRIGLSAHKLGVAGKTEISPVLEGVDFLGYKICINKVSVRDTSYSRMFKNILKVVTDFRYRHDVRRTLFRLNLKITGCIVDNRRRGWMMFFSRTEDMSQLAFLDRFVSEQLKRVGFPEEEMKFVKTFIKSYHQIKYNLDHTSYIPDFDDLTVVQKAELVSILSGRDMNEVLSWDVDTIEQQFSRLVSREVMDLEKDVGNLS